MQIIGAGCLPYVDRTDAHRFIWPGSQDEHQVLLIQPAKHPRLVGRRRWLAVKLCPPPISPHNLPIEIESCVTLRRPSGGYPEEAEMMILSKIGPRRRYPLRLLRLHMLCT